VLAVGFIYYTAIFWTQIIRNGDKRFLLEAVTVYLLWIVTAALITLPPVFAWQKWRAIKTQAMAYLLGPDYSSSQNLETIVKTVGDYTPIRPWSAIAPGVTALTSFVIPIVQAFHR
jgi:hypothetical protein